MVVCRPSHVGLLGGGSPFVVVRVRYGLRVSGITGGMTCMARWEMN